MYNTIILGAGASGMFLSSMINKKTLIIDHSKNLSPKVKIAGGGKCNITNKKISKSNYYPNHTLIEKTLQINNYHLLKWLKDRNIQIQYKKDKIFLHSSEILINEFKKTKHKISLNEEIIDIEFKKVFIVKTSKNIYTTKNLVVALGGKSFKKLGATELGYKIAQKFNHTITSLKPALVGLTVQPTQNWFKKLSGISFLAKVKINNKIFMDNILFSHKGITGPAILNTSLYWEKGNIIIDFLPEKNIKSLLNKKNKIISSQIPLPKRFIKEFLSSIKIKDSQLKYLSSEEINKLNLIHNYSFAPSGTFGFERAEVTKGGVKLDEIKDNFESKFQKNLFFIGEVLETTGELGGYNCQWAFSSSYILANYINRN